ncbi:MAG: caspase family protein [Methyloligellaceae bacterium]
MRTIGKMRGTKCGSDRARLGMRSLLCKTLFVFACLAMLISVSVVQPAKAQNMYGLVIGIDDYIGEKNDLAGAVNDAVDIEKALKSAGAAVVESFTNQEATKGNISRAWERLVNQAGEGDVIVLTFSGHGSQEPEPPGRGGEDDGLNENFLLANYQPSGQASLERIVDDEIFSWLKKADERGIRVIFIADSCHSGTMHRKATNNVRYRKGNFLKLVNDFFRYPDPDAAKLSVDDLNNVTFISATSDERLTPEVEIDGQWRGALSWSFARALEGGADRNQDGEVSQFELLGFIIPAVHAQVERQQTPQILPITASSESLFRVSSTGWQATFSASRIGRTRDADFGEIRVAIVGGSADTIANIASVRVVSDQAKADLVWFARRGQVVHRIGGVVAENVTDKSIVPVLAKWSTLKWLKAEMARDPISATLTKGNQRYKRGSIVEIQMTGARLPYLTLFNMPPNGRVEFLIPGTNRPDLVKKNWADQTFRNSFRVDKPPFGAEHLVAIYTGQVLSGLHTLLAAMSTPDKAVNLKSILQEVLKDKKFQITVLDIYTGNE